jgi:dihydrofolate reductase
VLAFVNELERPIGAYLYGRRMYETMVFCETGGSGSDQPAGMRDFATIWRAAEKIVYSRTLQTVSSAKTRIEHDLDTDAIRRLKETSGSDITIGGAELAGQAIAAGLVDELHLLLVGFDVNLSIHPAPIVQPSGREASAARRRRQCRRRVRAAPWEGSRV